jgi:hypothetical protein
MFNALLALSDSALYRIAQLANIATDDELQTIRNWMQRTPPAMLAEMYNSTAGFVFDSIAIRIEDVLNWQPSPAVVGSNFAFLLIAPYLPSPSPLPSFGTDAGNLNEDYWVNDFVTMFASAAFNPSPFLATLARTGLLC